MRRAHCALPSDRQPKIQPAIATFSAGEFRRQPALSDNTVFDVPDLLLPSSVITCIVPYLMVGSGVRGTFFDGLYGALPKR